MAESRCTSKIVRSFTIHKGVYETLVIVRRYWWMHSFFATTCSNMYMNNVCRAGTFPWGFSVYCEMSKKTNSNSQKRIQFLCMLFFSFSTCSKAGGWPYSVSNWSECLSAPSSSTWPSKAQSTSAIDRPRLHVCTDCLGDRKSARNPFWRFDLQALQRECVFFFFFCCRLHNKSGPNPSPIWKFFRLSAMCEILRWPLNLWSFGVKLPNNVHKK